MLGTAHGPPTFTENNKFENLIITKGYLLSL